MSHARRLACPSALGEMALRPDRRVIISVAPMISLRCDDRPFGHPGGKAHRLSLPSKLCTRIFDLVSVVIADPAIEVLHLEVLR